MDRSCEECDRLWREYGEATTTHIRLTSKLQVAALSHENDNIADLTPKVERAEKARSDARAAIRRHESEGHLNSDSASANL